MSDHQAISNEQVRAELERVLASRGFANAGRLSRLLRHSVEKTLAGEADQLKEYSVGMEVFDRDDKYDPRVDSIVRVEAGRLRSRLDEYYTTDGAGNAVRISLPRGAYVAQFELRSESPAVAGAATAAAVSVAAPLRTSPLLGAMGGGRDPGRIGGRNRLVAQPNDGHPGATVGGGARVRTVFSE